jgi:Rieske Fe-S protein
VSGCDRCRRRVVKGVVGGGVAMMLGDRREALAASQPSFVKLEAPIDIPLSSLAKDWEPVNFRALFLRPDGKRAAAPGLAVRLPGVGVQALCLYCPHELCIMALDRAKHLFCGCHSSTFDPLKRGAWMSGPSPRDTYRYDVSLSPINLRITAIEADLVERLS